MKENFAQYEQDRAVLVVWNDEPMLSVAPARLYSEGEPELSKGLPDIDWAWEVASWVRRQGHPDELVNRVYAEAHGELPVRLETCHDCEVVTIDGALGNPPHADGCYHAWRPTHRVYRDGHVSEVYLHGTGAAYTLAEWVACGPADYERADDGGWLFQGEPFAGHVVRLISRDEQEVRDD